MNIPYSIIQNCTAHDNGLGGQSHGFYMGDASISNLTFADNFLIENCQAYNNTGAGFHLNRCGSGVVRYNISHDNGYIEQAGWGIVVYEIVAGKNVDVYYNIIYNNYYYGINVGYLHTGCTANIWNNVVYNNGQAGSWGDGLLLESNDDVSNGAIEIRNNLIFSNPYWDMRQVNNAAQYTVSNNLYWKSTGNMITWSGTAYTQAQFATYKTASGDATSISADPTVTNAGAYDFTLLTGSPCINAGASLGLTRDYLGNPIIGLPDIGAYEKQ